MSCPRPKDAKRITTACRLKLELGRYCHSSAPCRFRGQHQSVDSGSCACWRSRPRVSSRSSRLSSRLMSGGSSSLAMSCVAHRSDEPMRARKKMFSTWAMYLGFRTPWECLIPYQVPWVGQFDIRGGPPKSSPCAGRGEDRHESSRTHCRSRLRARGSKGHHKAFDQAWAELAPQTSTRPQAIDAARLRLANIVLSLATEDSSDVEALRVVSVCLFRNQAP
jgi:hypothetical protein